MLASNTIFIFRYLRGVEIDCCCVCACMYNKLYRFSMTTQMLLRETDLRRWLDVCFDLKILLLYRTWSSFEMSADMLVPACIYIRLSLFPKFNLIHFTIGLACIHWGQVVFYSLYLFLKFHYSAFLKDADIYHLQQSNRDCSRTSHSKSV